MRFPSEEVIRNLREHYPAGARVELLQMDDPLSRILDKMSYQYF